MTSKLVKKNQLRKGSKIYIVPSVVRPLPNMVMILPLKCDRKNPEFRDFFIYVAYILETFCFAWILFDVQNL